MKKIGLVVLVIVLSACSQAKLDGPVEANSVRAGIVGPGSSNHQMKKEYRDLIDTLGNISDKMERVREFCDTLDDEMGPFNEELSRRAGAPLDALSSQRDQLISDLDSIGKEISEVDRAMGKKRGTIFALDKIRSARSQPNAYVALWTEFFQIKRGHSILRKALRRSVRYRNQLTTYIPDWYFRDDMVRSAVVNLETSREEMKVLRWYLMDTRAQELNSRLNEEIGALQAAFASLQVEQGAKIEMRNGLSASYLQTVLTLSRLNVVDGTQPLGMPAICSSFD